MILFILIPLLLDKDKKKDAYVILETLLKDGLNVCIIKLIIAGILKV
jgi:hypothetical protein